MENYIQISKLNDYIFCPKSLYFHSIYENFSEKTFHSCKQTVGKIHHQSIENISYSSRKDILQGIPVYSNKYNLMGKIDIFNQKTGELVERKYNIKKIYDGYKLQIYAQYLCLKEMGYHVKSISLYSLADNKKYKIKIPNKSDIKFLEQIINAMYSHNPTCENIKINTNKCNNCIYNPLCNT
jgi:CRISPR-associated protein Cas4